VKSTKNSISYVEWSYAIDNKLGIAQIDNGSGPVELSTASAGKALSAAKPVGTGNDLALKLDYATKAPGAYPIILVTYEIACSKGLPAEKTALVKSFLSYFASSDGQGSLVDLNYAPLPEELRTKVDAAIQEIHRRSPAATVYWVGYPAIVPNTGYGCWPTFPIAWLDVPFLRDVERRLNGMLATQAAANGATYVDVYTPSIGHDVCKSSGVRWVEGLVPTVPAYPVHPNALGNRGMAGAVLARMAA